MPVEPHEPSRPSREPDDGGREDAALVARIQAAGRGGTGDERAAWAQLVERYQHRLYAVCLRMVGKRDAADVCQSALVKIIQGLAGFDSRSQFSTWALRVTMNVCLSHIRSRKLREHARLDDSGSGRMQRPGAPIREHLGPSGVQQGDSSPRLQAALDRLDSEQRALLVLRDVRGLDYSQLAQVMGVAEGTIKSRLFRAREALRQELEREGPSA